MSLVLQAFPAQHKLGPADVHVRAGPRAQEDARMSASRRILIVEDEMMIALHIEDTLTQLGHEICTVTTVAHAERMIEASRIDLAIVDYKLTDGNTESLMERLQSEAVPFIVCSGISEPDE